MDSRVNKYDNNVKSMSRVSKHEELYKEINDEELDNYRVGSNATVIGNQNDQIDLEKLKSILDKRYNSVPKRKSIRVEPREVEQKETQEDTKEYDLKVVLEKAKDEKEESYDDVRAKKLRNTQYDILNNLKIDEDKYKTEEENTKKEENKPSGEEDLMKLINTITFNEAKKNENESNADPLDILENLKGSDNSQVYEGMAEKLQEVEVKTIEEVKKVEEVKTEVNKDKVLENAKDGLDNSFYSNNLFKKKDFVKDEDDESDFLEDDKLSIGIKILIVVVVLVFAVGLFLFLKSFL